MCFSSYLFRVLFYFVNAQVGLYDMNFWSLLVTFGNVVVLCVCVYVCPLIPAASHTGMTKERFIAIQGSFKIWPICLKMFHSKVMA